MTTYSSGTLGVGVVGRVGGAVGAITKPEMVLAGGADNVLDSDSFFVDFVDPLPTVDGVKEARDRAELAVEIVGGASGLAGGEDRRDVAGDSG